MVAIAITRSISIDSDEIIESYTRASGPGGQHVNTTDSAVVLRFDVANSPGLPDAVKYRLADLAGTRMTREGILILRSEGARSQLLNRQDVRDRLIALIREATIDPIKTPPDQTHQGLAKTQGRGQGKARDHQTGTRQGAGGLGWPWGATKRLGIRW